MKAKQTKRFAFLAMLLTIAIQSHSRPIGGFYLANAGPIPQLMFQTGSGTDGAQQKSRVAIRAAGANRPVLRLDLSALSTSDSPCILAQHTDCTPSQTSHAPAVKEGFWNDGIPSPPPQNVALVKRGGKGMNRHLAAAAFAASLATVTATLSVFANGLKAHDQDKYGVSKKTNLSSSDKDGKSKDHGEKHSSSKSAEGHTKGDSTAKTGKGDKSPDSPTFVTNINNYYTTGPAHPHGRRGDEGSWSPASPFSTYSTTCLHCDAGDRDDDDVVGGMKGGECKALTHRLPSALLHVCKHFDRRQVDVLTATPALQRRGWAKYDHWAPLLEVGTPE